MRKQVGRGHSDAGGSRGEPPLSLANVGAPPQQVERQSGLHLRGNGRDRPGRLELVDQRFRILADQYRDGIVRRPHLGGQRREPRAQGGKLPLREGEVQGVGKPAFVTGLHEIERLLRGVDALAGSGELHLQSPHVQIGTRDIGDHGDQHAIASLGCCLRIVAARFDLAPVFPEEIDLPAGVETRRPVRCG